MAAIEGRVREATQLHFKLLGLHKHLFCEPSPAPTKWALAQMGPLAATICDCPSPPLTAQGQQLVATP